jgi:spermidine synthase
MAKKVAARQAAPYDMIMVDAYFSDAIPYHLATLEFLRSMRGALAPDGVVAANLIGALSGKESRLLRAMTRTYAAIFGEVYLFPVGVWSKNDWPYRRNVILVSTPGASRWSKDDWTGKAAALRADGILKEDLMVGAQSLVDEAEFWREPPCRDAPVLTDDYAPVDTLQHEL